MISGWCDKPLSELCTYINRGAAPAYTEEGGILVLNQKCVRDQRVSFDKARRSNNIRKPVSRDRMLRPFDIVVNSTGVGTLGRVAQIGFLPEPCTFDSHLTVVRPDPACVNPQYLGYAVRHFEPEIEALGEGSTGQTELARGRLADFTVPVPPLPEQRAIALVLGTLDDKIELNRRMNATLEEIARTLFRAWFVDFEPVRAKMAGRPPVSCDAATALFPDRLVDSPLGEIPEGWEVTKLSSVCTTQYGFTASAEKNGDGPKFLRVTDINKEDWIVWSNVPHCPISAADYTKYALAVGDILVARMADPGKAALVDEDVNAVFASYLVRLKFDSLARSLYAFRFLKSAAYQEYAAGAMTGSVQKNLNARLIVDVPLVWPPPEVVEAFFQLTWPLRQLLRGNVNESKTLTDLRDTLLPKLLSGELRVPVAADMVEAA